MNPQLPPHSVDFYACGKHVLAECKCSAPWRRHSLSQIPCPTCNPVGKPAKETK